MYSLFSKTYLFISSLSGRRGVELKNLDGISDISPKFILLSIFS